MIFSDTFFSPPITGEAALQREEGSILLYYLILACVHFSMALLKASSLSAHRHAERGIAAKVRGDTGADPGRGGTDRDLNLQVVLSLTH